MISVPKLSYDFLSKNFPVLMYCACTLETQWEKVYLHLKTQAKSIRLTVEESCNTGNMHDLRQRGGGLV